MIAVTRVAGAGDGARAAKAAGAHTRLPVKPVDDAPRFRFATRLMSCCPSPPDDPAEQQECSRSGTRGRRLNLNTVKALLGVSALARMAGLRIASVRTPRAKLRRPAARVAAFEPRVPGAVRGRLPTGFFLPLHDCVLLRILVEVHGVLLRAVGHRPSEPCLVLLCQIRSETCCSLSMRWR
jgi:hypothetical protein